MKQSIKGRLSLAIVAVVLLVILLFGLVTSLSVRKEFRTYVKRQQEKKTETIVDSIQHSYQMLQGEWDENELHAIGMSALYEGFIITIYDKEGEVVWDAESHDMTLCNQIRNEITTRMQKDRANSHGVFETYEYDLTASIEPIGKVNVSFYGPYFYSQNDFSFLNAFSKIVLAVGSVALALAIGIAYLLAKNISKPILEAVEVTDYIANGQYEAMHWETTNIIELDRLSVSIHKMAEAITRQERLRKQLTTDVAHELRTPLTVVSTQLEAMLDGIWEANPLHLESCYEEVNRIMVIVKDLEQLERLESDRYTLKYSCFSFYALAKRVLEKFALPMKEKELVVSLSNREVLITADEERLTQVMVNLLSNAVKYTERGDKIEILVEENQEEIRIQILDTGIGIDMEELPYVFERFYRADKSRNRKTGGAGIGLAIVKSIVEAHKGSIVIESEKGKGTMVEVLLPKRNVDIKMICQGGNLHLSLKSGGE